MAVTAGGTPYVESTDLVANYPATSLSLANKVDTKVDYALPVNAQTGTTYTFVLADGLRLTTASNAASSTYTIPPQASVVWLDNSVIRLVNYGAGVVTVAGGSGVTVTNAAATLAQFESVALIRTGSDAWTLVPFSGGASNADFSDTATGTYTDGGFNYKYITYTASGTLTVTTAGFADVLVVGGGGGGAVGQGGGGGGGGHLYKTNAYLESGSLTVTVGAGGGVQTSQANTGLNGLTGNASRIGEYFSPGGAGGSGFSVQYATTNVYAQDGQNGGSGSGASGYDNGAGRTGGTGTTDLGNNGGNSASGAGGGGGGASAVGANATTNTGGAGGAGLANSITNTSVTRAGGGGGGGNTTGGAAGTGGGGAGSSSTTGAAGGVNTGGAGGGGISGNNTSAGGSGLVIVRVKV